MPGSPTNGQSAPIPLRPCPRRIGCRNPLFAVIPDTSETSETFFKDVAGYGGTWLKLYPRQKRIGGLGGIGNASIYSTFPRPYFGPRYRRYRKWAFRTYLPVPSSIRPDPATRFPVVKSGRTRRGIRPGAGRCRRFRVCPFGLLSRSHLGESRHHRAHQSFSNREHSVARIYRV